jgi:tyrosyl-tRNA synthetase
MLMGLKEGQEKMSKSDPDSAIFMEDTADDVKRKIKKAYCPPQIVEKNPIMDYAKHLIFGYYGKMAVTVEVVRKSSFFDTSSLPFSSITET